MSQDVELIGEMRRWEDLPGAVLSHLLQLAPYKRADVKLVCKAWRTAVNAAMTTVSLPAEDLDLLHQLTAVQVLAATTPPSHADAQPAEQAHSADQHSQCASSSSANPWSSAHQGTLQRLRVLRLQGCPTALAQLAEWQAQQLAKHVDSSSSGDDSRPGLDSLQVLSLHSLGDVSTWLPVVLTGQGACEVSCQDGTGAGSSWAAAAKPWPLQHLTQLQLHLCRLRGHHGGELSVLQQLPRLQSLELSCCHLAVLPAAVCGCTGLTQLSLGHNHIARLPETVSRLSKLQVLDLSSNSHLACLGSAFSRLSSLTELNLSGPNLLFKDHHAHSSAHTATAAAAGSADPERPPADSAAQGDDALPMLLDVPELPTLSHEQQQGLLPQLGVLTSLRKLSLAHNRDMRVLPGSLAGATGLEVLDVGSCSLRFLGDELWECVGLRELLLGDNVLAALGEEISKLQQLEVLDIGCCHMLWRLPAALLSLRQLRRLVLATKAVDQGMVERLELRSPNPVDVEFDGYEDEEEDELPVSEDVWSDSGPSDAEGDGGSMQAESDSDVVPSGLQGMALGAAS